MSWSKTVPRSQGNWTHKGARRDFSPLPRSQARGPVKGLRPLVVWAFVLLLVGPALSSLPTGLHQLSPVDPTHASNQDWATGEGPLSESRSTEGRTCYIDLSPAEPFFGLDPTGVVNASFTVRECNNVGVALTSASWRILTLQGDEVEGGHGSTASDLRLEGLGSIDWSIDLDVGSDLYGECMALGWDRLRVVVTLRGTDDGGSSTLVSSTSPLHLTQRVAMLVDEDLYPLITDGLDRYEADVQREGSVEFLTRTGRWSSAESVRALLKQLWQNEGITGAILWGYLPSAMWEIVHSETDIETFTIPIFYEDLDGVFQDTDGDGYYDKHYWGENDGPEIWVSLMMPPRTTIPSENLDPYGYRTGGGLLGRYYDSDHLTHLNLTRVDPTIEFFWEWQCPEELDMDDFSVEWTGHIKADSTDTYTISLFMGGGNRVWIDGVLLIDEMHRVPFARTERLVSVRLTEGWHPIRMEHYENGWGYNWTSAIHLMWSSDTLLAEAINDYLETAHAFHMGDLEYPERALLFMDHCYGYKCRMIEPVKGKHIEPLYGDRIVVGGGKTDTSGSDYIEFLEEGYELVSVWSHAGSAGHWMNSPDLPEGESPSADSWMVRRTEGGLVTLIWGCHAGDYEKLGSADTALSENLAANYAFGTPHGLASIACTRSYGTTLDNVYWAWQNGSSMSTGYFAYKDRVYNESFQTWKNPIAGVDRWVDDEVMFGDPFLRIDHRPSEVELTIDGGAEFTTGRAVTLSLHANDAQGMRFKNDGGEWSSWEPYSPVKEWTLGSSTGAHRVFLQVRNDWGIAWFQATDVITLVGTLVEDVSVEINGGEELTNRTKLYLSVDVSGADASRLLMSIRDDSTEWTGWEPFATQFTWDLSSGDGERTVSVRVSEDGGIWMKEVSDGIRLDTRPPITEPTVLGDIGRYDWYVSDVTVDLGSHDALSGVAKVLYSIDDGPWSESDGPLVVCEDGKHVLRYHATDVAGNSEATKEVTFMLDRSPPGAVSIALDGGGDHTNIPSVQLKVEARDPVSGLDTMSFKVDDGEWGREMPFRASFLLSLPPEEGPHEVGLRVTDVAGNIAGPIWYRVFLDVTSPSISFATPEDGAVGVPVDRPVVVSFDEPMDPASILGDKVLIRATTGDTVPAWITFDEDACVLTCVPDAPLRSFTDYTVMLMGGMYDLAGNPLDLGAWSRWTFRTVGHAPDAPGPLAAVADVGVELSWGSPEDEGSAPVTGYKVYRMMEGLEDDFVLVATGESTVFRDPDVLVGFTYTYRVAAINEVGEGQASETVSVLVPDGTEDEPQEPEVPDEPDNLVTPVPLASEPDGPKAPSGIGGTEAMLLVIVVVASTVAALMVLRGRRR